MVACEAKTDNSVDQNSEVTNRKKEARACAILLRRVVNTAQLRTQCEYCIGISKDAQFCEHILNMHTNTSVCIVYFYTAYFHHFLLCNWHGANRINSMVKIKTRSRLIVVHADAIVTCMEKDMSRYEIIFVFSFFLKVLMNIC